ncbi:hypothetical protein, partial [Pontiella sp.]|uniref:hypothetical protein n=1 Tax=Pontiella sp. TaxID=2837462 RepID=UPI003569C119
YRPSAATTRERLRSESAFKISSACSMPAFIVSHLAKCQIRIVLSTPDQKLRGSFLHKIHPVRISADGFSKRGKSLKTRSEMFQAG